ncbi:MAG TPA: helix-turn-helix domain-containing protein [Acidimicrobiia bacterium]|nr:helix-turn-helix domain-containing protein [Acidimicrobiia bacterium]
MTASVPVQATKTKRASALPPDERRSMIVAATLPLLLEHGDRVTSRQIAEAAGIAEGTIFRAFADKDEIIVAVIEAALDPEPLEAALGDIAHDLAFEDRLTAAVVIMQQRVINVWQVMSSVGTRFHAITSRPMADSDALVGLFEASRNMITVAPVAAARLLRALTLSTTHPMLADEPKSPAELVQLFLHGVGGGAVPC